MTTINIAQAVADFERDEQLQVVEQINGRPITRGQLTAAFNKVADKANWKNPIDGIVYAPSKLGRQIISRAVVFFTGCVPTFEHAHSMPKGWYRVRARGYYLTIGA